MNQPEMANNDILKESINIKLKTQKDDQDSHTKKKIIKTHCDFNLKRIVITKKNTFNFVLFV